MANNRLYLICNVCGEHLMLAKDCKYYQAKQQNLPWKQNRKYCTRAITLNMDPDDYCSKGQIKNEAKE